MEEGDFNFLPSLNSLVPADAAHHEPAFVSVNCGVQSNIDKVVNVLDFKKADYGIIYLILDELIWDEILISLFFEDNVNSFYAEINDIVASNVPKKVSRT